MTRDEKFRIKRRMSRSAIMGNAGLLLKAAALAAYLIGLSYVWSNHAQIAALSVGVELVSPVVEAALHYCTKVYAEAVGFFCARLKEEILCSHPWHSSSWWVSPWHRFASP